MIKKVLATVALTLAMAVGVTAQAAWSDCSNYPGTICLFAGPNYGLPIWRQFPREIDGCRNLTGFDNVTTVAANLAPHYAVYLYQYPGCTGAVVSLPTQGYVVSWSGHWFNDKASSIEVIAA
jgi:hypothetical protein